MTTKIFYGKGDSRQDLYNTFVKTHKKKKVNVFRPLFNSQKELGQRSSCFLYSQISSR